MEKSVGLRDKNQDSFTYAVYAKNHCQVEMEHLVKSRRSSIKDSFHFAVHASTQNLESELYTVLRIPHISSLTSVSYLKHQCYLFDIPIQFFVSFTSAIYNQYDEILVYI